MNTNFWQGKRVFLTGHTGFKGGWLTLWLQTLGAEVTGFALAPNTQPNLFELATIAKGIDSVIGDIRDFESLQKAMQEARPEIVLHLAAQPLVRESYANPLDTFSINMMGTAHVLESCRWIDGVRVAVMITTDKVYQNNNWLWPYRETDILGGVDPYSASKAACELVIASYRDAFLRERSVAIASARAGNVIGGGDWSGDRLVPDAIRAWQAGETLLIRRPDAIRPWQHVLEPLWGYLTLAEALWSKPDLAGSFNFGPEQTDAVAVRTVIEKARTGFKDAHVHYETAAGGPHEAARLSLDNTKARELLGVSPVWNLETTIRRTMNWYAALRRGECPRELCNKDIAAFMDSMEQS